MDEDDGADDGTDLGDEDDDDWEVQLAKQDCELLDISARRRS